MLGNDAIFKCSVPSFVADFVSAESWVDSEGGDFHPRASSPGNCQPLLFQDLCYTMLDNFIISAK